MLLFMLLVPYGIYRLYKAFYEYIEGLVNDIRRRIWDPNSYYAKTESVGVISFIVAAMYILPVLGRYGLVTELEDLMGDLVESELIWNFVDFATTGLGGSIIMFFVFALLGIVAFTYIGTQRRMTEQFVRTGGRKSFY